MSSSWWDPTLPPCGTGPRDTQMWGGGGPLSMDRVWGAPGHLAQASDLIFILGQIVPMKHPFGDSALSCPCLRPSPRPQGPGPSPCWSLGTLCLKVCFPRTQPQRMTPATSPMVTASPQHEAGPAAPQPQTRPRCILFPRCRPGPLREPHQGLAGAPAQVPGMPCPQWAGLQYSEGHPRAKPRCPRPLHLNKPFSW